MRAQRPSVRRSGVDTTPTSGFVKNYGILPGRPLDAIYERLLVVADEHGAPPGLDRKGVIGRIRHRHRVGFAAGVRPAGTLPSPAWITEVESLGLEAVQYAVSGGMEHARLVGAFEIVARVARALLRDMKVDVVLLLAPTVPPDPLARMIHETGRALIVADLAERLMPWELADATFSIDAFVAGERTP